MASITQFSAEADNFAKLVNNDKLDEGKQQLAKLKICMTHFPSLVAGLPSATEKEERLIARSVLENACILSVKRKDMPEFEKHMAQLRVYHVDYSAQLGQSDMRHPLLGLQLLALLIDNRMSEFHAELETLSDQDREHPCVAYAVKMEQYLMEGSYLKVLELRNEVPSKIYDILLTGLLQTVRDATAECCEIAYDSITIPELQKMLFFDSAQDLSTYMKEKKQEWVVQGNQIHFKSPQTSVGADDIPSRELISETLAYATELDRIV